jgi:Right handed beta helix region
MMNKHLLSTIIFFFSTTILFCQSSYYVDGTSGNDANDGTTLAKAWKTIQKAFSTSIPPKSTIFIKGGIYKEELNVNFSGNATDYVTVRPNTASDIVIIDGDSSGVKKALLTIKDRSYVKIIGLQFRNAIGNGSTGILISGTSRFIEISKNQLSNIHFSLNPNETVAADKNVNPLLVRGDNSTTSIRNIVIDSNIIYNCRTGYSEALTVSGNVDTFEVKRNIVRDITNIGIDIAGHYSACSNCVNPSDNQARNGKVFSNTIYRCRSTVAVSAGIYVDGGRDIVVERNEVYECGRGFQIGCENTGKSASNIKLRENFAYRNDQAGIGIGTSNRGKVINCLISNNSTYGNGVANKAAELYGELSLDYTEQCSIRNNIFYATNPSNRIWTGYGTPSVGLNFDYNLWYLNNNNAQSAIVEYNNVGYTGLVDYKMRSGQDTNSIFGNPLYVSTNDLGNGVRNLRIQINSGAINKGDPAFVAAKGETDFDGESRIQLSRVDIGADELSSLTSIKNADVISELIKIYPSITDGNLTIEGAVKVEVFSIEGQLLFAQKVSDNTQFSIGHLANGIYIVKGVDALGGILMTKLVKQ